MAESDTILQLGIEAAREGNREEARSLFSLLTRQEPDNTQAWLWLAGVAETPDERRAALERVVALDPNNDMARKGLQAMGVDPGTIPAQGSATAPTVAAAPVATPVAPAPVGDVDLDDDARYASELDAAFDDDYEAVEKVGGGIRNTPTSYRGDDDDDAAAAYGAGSARERVESRRAVRARAYGDDDDDDAEPQRRGPSGLLLGLIGAILVLALGFLLWQFFANRGAGGDVVGTPTDTAAQTSVAGGGGASGTTTAGETGALPGGTGAVTDTGTVSGTGEVTGTGAVTDTGGTPPPPVETPQVQPPVANNSDLAAANPQQVPVGTTLEAAGFSYNFPQANYAVSLPGTVGSATAQNGRFVEVLMLIANTSGAPQTIPADLFVLKDAQGRIHSANTAASEAFVQPGVNADLSMEDQVPANGLAYSVALMFDVPQDATGLVLFTRAKQDQGFLVLP